MAWQATFTEATYDEEIYAIAKARIEYKEGKSISYKLINQDK